MSNLRDFEDDARENDGPRFLSSLPAPTAQSRAEHSWHIEGDEFHIDGGCPAPRPRWSEIEWPKKRWRPGFPQVKEHTSWVIALVAGALTIIGFFM